MIPRILSIQIGRPTQYGVEGADDPLDRPWTTAFFKSPVAVPVEVEIEGIVGDGQADRINHGGIDKAVLLYSAHHAEPWREELGGVEVPPGGFGENLTVEGLDESSVCIGDRWRFGAVVLEVSQPRQPCWKLGRRWRRPELVKRVVQTGRTGWYSRVVATGSLRAPCDGELVARPQPAWTVQRANEVFYHRRAHPDGVRQLAALPELALVWREELHSTAP